MSKSRKPAGRTMRFISAMATACAMLALAAGSASAGDAQEGEKVFKKCSTCHMVGDGARHKVGPQLNGLIGRHAGTSADYKFSTAMVKAGEEGLVWTAETLRPYLENPRKALKGTKMSFAGLKKDDQLDDVIAYLATFSQESAAPSLPTTSGASAATDAAPQTAAAAGAIVKAADAPRHGRFNLGREATQSEIAAWDIDVRPDGAGLPVGRGTVAQGEEIFAERCAVCHGDFGEGVDRWPVLAGGQDSLKSDRPEKTIGSYWPYLSTVWDYVHRAMPFGDAQSLTDDEVYAVVAYLLYLNDIVTEEEFELSNENFATTRLPNEANFFMDDRAEEKHIVTGEPCMTDCTAEQPKLRMRARILDVTPDSDDEGGKGAIE